MRRIVAIASARLLPLFLLLAANTTPLIAATPANPDLTPSVAPVGAPSAERSRADDPAFRATVLERFRAAAPAGSDAVQGLDETGGDDVRVVTAAGIVTTGGGPSMDIADNGDIYIAITVDTDASASTHFEVRVYWSQDDGRTWSLFGTLANATSTTWYANPSLHIGEGTQNRVYVACEYYVFQTNTTIRVAYKPLGSSAGAWTERTALSTFGIAYQRPSLYSSEQTVAGYVLFLAAVGRDNDGDDIWFNRSTDFDNTWGTPFEVASLSTVAVDRNYTAPKVRYGNGGVVSVIYEFAPQASTGLDHAIRYRRALNQGATAADWQTIQLLTSNNNGEDETWADVAASPVNSDILITYAHHPPDFSTDGTASLASTNLGVSFGAASPIATLDPLALTVDAAGDFHLGSDQNPGQENAAVMKLDAPLPGSWSAALNFSDRLYVDGDEDFTADCLATDPTHGHQAAMAWLRQGASGAVDTLFFDAEWHDDAGWPNQAPGFPKALASDPYVAPAICEYDGDDKREIVFGTFDGNVHLVHHDGSELSGWPKNIGTFPPGATIAVGDIDGDGNNEVVTGNTAGQIYAFHGKGQLMPGFPVYALATTNVYVSLGRFGPNNRLDIVATAGPRILKVRGDGVLDPAGAILLGGAIAAPAAIGDVDHDGDNEYVVVTANPAAVVVVRPENTIQASRQLGIGKTFSAPVALADLDLNGNLEIIAATDQGDVYLLHPDCTDLTGWPKSVSAGSKLNSPIAADVSGTSAPEVFWAEQGAGGAEVQGYFVTGSAVTGFPKAGTGTLYGTPIVDYMVGSPEVFFATTDGGYSWNNVGVLNEGWPKTLTGAGDVTAASGDVDNDGLLDVVFLTYGSTHSINLIQTHAPLIRTPGLVTHWWSMYGYNPERQFCLACSPLDQVTGVAPGANEGLRLDAAPSVGRAFAFTLELPAAGPVRLEMFDLGGRRVRTLLKDELSAGVRTVNWDARRDEGAPVAAGVYYARLSATVAGRVRQMVQRVVVLR